MPRKSQKTKTATAEPADSLNPAQRVFCHAYLENGFNGTRAYMTAHPDCKEATAAVEAHRSLRNPKIVNFLNPLLEAAWKPYQMGGEQALARVGVMAASALDARVRLAALRTILEQSGKLKSIPDSIDALAAALRADLEAHKDA